MLLLEKLLKILICLIRKYIDLLSICIVENMLIETPLRPRILGTIFQGADNDTRT